MSLPVDSELRRQAENWARRFATDHGFTRDDFMSQLPQFAMQPTQFRGKFDVPLIVINDLPLERLMEKVNVKTKINLVYLRDRDFGQRRSQAQQEVVWVNYDNEVESLANRTPRGDLDKLAKDSERPLTVREALSICLHNPDLMDRFAIICAGSTFGRNRDTEAEAVPFLKKPAGYNWVNLDYIPLNAYTQDQVVEGRKWLLPIKGVDNSPVLTATPKQLWEDLLKDVNLDI